MILSFRIDRSVQSVDPDQTAPEEVMKRHLESERCEVGTLIAGGTVTLPSHKGALCRRQEKGRAGEGVSIPPPCLFLGVRGISKIEKI